MKNIEISAAQRTPKVSLDVSRRIFEIEGESYPEDTKKFYEIPIAQVLEFLAFKHQDEVICKFKFKYFNSSSAKVLMDLFTAIEDSANKGNQVKVEWYFIFDDDNMKELGEEFSEELSYAKFELIEYS